MRRRGIPSSPHCAPSTTSTRRISFCGVIFFSIRVKIVLTSSNLVLVDSVSAMFEVIYAERLVIELSEG